MADNIEPKKRRFKNPETFRERALKASENSEKSDTSEPKKGFLRKLFAPIARLFSKLKEVRFLKPVFKVFRVIGRIIVPNYFRSSYQELKKVTWPSFKQSRKLTYAVLVFAIVFGAAIAIVDYGLGKIFRHLLLK